MRLRVHAAVRGLPRTVIAFTVLALVLVVVDWVVYFPRLSTHLLGNAVWCVLGLGVLAAIVLWRQRWAWWLYLLVLLAYVVSPAWGARLHPVADAIDLDFIGLLLAPSMRAYVRAARQPNKTRQPRQWVPWLLCLCVAGVVILPIAVDPRHPSHRAVVYRLIADVIVWLVLAGALRVLAVIVQKLGRLAGSLRRAIRP
jgi:hypothetical protein